MALEGTLEDFSLADIFQLIGIQRKTGILTLKNTQETVTVTFHNGMVIGADTSPRKLEDRIGKVFVKTGLITQDQLKDALEYQQKTLQKVGFILVDQKFISRDQLKEALRIQVTQMVYRLFRWNSGEYYFDQKSLVDPNSDESIPPMSAESILMEGIHMIDEWPVIQKKIPHFDVIFRPLISVEDLSSPDPSLNGSEKERMSKDEEMVFRLVDGKNSVADIIDSNKLGEFHTCKALYELLDRKFIEPHIMGPRVFRPQSIPVTPQEVVTPESGPGRAIFIVLGLSVIVLFFVNLQDPLKLGWLHFFQKGDESILTASADATRLQLVDAAVIMFFEVNGRLPGKLEDLVNARYLAPENVVDARSRPYLYTTEGATYTLSGFAADGKAESQMRFQRTLTQDSRLSQKSKQTPPVVRLEN